jgi:hypothetical protein
MGPSPVEEGIDDEDAHIQRAMESELLSTLLTDANRDFERILGKTVSAVYVREGSSSTNAVRIDLHYRVVPNPERKFPVDISDYLDLEIFLLEKDDTILEATGYLLSDDVLLREFYTNREIMPQVQTQIYSGDVRMTELEFQ